MTRPPYPGFTKLNNRRLALIEKKYHGGGISEQEDREMEMLGTVVMAMCHFRWPYRDFEKEFKEETGMTLDEYIAKEKEKEKEKKK